MTQYRLGSFVRIKGIIKWGSENNELPILWFNNQACITPDADRNLTSIVRLFKASTNLKRPKVDIMEVSNVSKCIKCYYIISVNIL